MGGSGGARVRPPRTLPDAPRGLSVLNRSKNDTLKTYPEVGVFLRGGERSLPENRDNFTEGFEGLSVFLKVFNDF